MKKIILLLIFTYSLNAGCNDSSNANVATNNINSNYNSEDSSLASIIASINLSMENNNKIDENSFLVAKDLVSLHSKELLKIKEFSLQLDNQKKIIFNQR